MQKRRYLRETLDGADLLVLTDTNRGRLRALREEFPVTNGFYDGLWAGDGEFRRIAAFEIGPTLAGRPVDDSGAEPTFRLFDHPRVYIYRRAEGQ